MSPHEVLSIEVPALAQFQRDVVRGLRRRPKELPCKYFYDARGSALFEQICDLDEYYLTRTELAIMHRHAGSMARALGPRCHLIEFGSGSGIKTQVLLDHLVDPVAYTPVEIAPDALEVSASRLALRYPGLDITPVCADFTTRFTLPPTRLPAARRVVYFPGSTIGNFGPEGVRQLLHRIAELCGPGGGLLIGVDLKKDPATLERAYDDRAGVTAAFNLNLLARINRELHADFVLDAFRHRAVYNAALGRIEMHLVSLQSQVVHVGDAEIRFADGESIHTESSYKYDLPAFQALAEASGLEVEAVWMDDAKLFSVQYLRVC